MSKVLYKSKYHGWIMEESIKLNDTTVLDISTRKLNGKVKTTAMVSHIKDGFKSTAIFQDFYKVYVTYDVKRVTEKSIRDLHNAFDTSIAVNDSKLFYGIE